MKTNVMLKFGRNVDGNIRLMDLPINYVYENFWVDDLILTTCGDICQIYPFESGKIVDCITYNILLSIDENQPNKSQLNQSLIAH